MDSPIARVEGGVWNYKILVLGCSDVGKTSLIQRYTTGICPSGMMGTFGMDYRIKTVQVEGIPVKLKIWDTAGQERFYTLTKQFFRGTDGIMLMYDITKASSFTDIRRWIDAVEEAGLSDQSMILIGNKCDLQEDRAVESTNGQQLADTHNCPFFETSAKTGHNVKQVFYEVARGILIRHGMFLPGRLPSLDPVVVGGKSIKLTTNDLEPQKKKCCMIF